MLEALERRELLTAEMSVFEGTTQIYNWAYASFGQVNVGSQATLQFSITDSGNQPLNVYYPSVGSGFSVQGSFPMYLNPNQSSNFSVSMNTASAGSYSSQLWVSNNTSDNNPFLINLAGTVGSPSPAISVFDGSTTIPNDPSGSGSNPDNFGTTTVGTPVNKTFTISNSSANNISITSGSLSLPSGFSLVGPFPSSISRP